MPLALFHLKRGSGFHSMDHRGTTGNRKGYYIRKVKMLDKKEKTYCEPKLLSCWFSCSFQVFTSVDAHISSGMWKNYDKVKFDII